MAARRSRIVVVLILALLLAGTLVGYALRNPLRKPSEKIRESLLEMTPLGSDEVQVKAALDSAGLQHVPGRKDADMLWRYRVDHGDRAESAICSNMGGYTNLGEFGYIPFHVDVRAIWVFDRDGKLFDIEVHKVIDSP